MPQTWLPSTDCTATERGPCYNMCRVKQDAVQAKPKRTLHFTDGDDREYRGLIQDFADWCLRNNLQINASKTKELVDGFPQV
ncbi:hypothetical protein L3Q82_004923 [Scortum barcoo]|uniref:Uncharacterized protein n=1 Tax=Scortum barcoo TaxID=214431 RepID=A0ACB8VDE2_9TELE|nr:hypothetical protein L3Q82_004923 [Scortum barcoo]